MEPSFLLSLITSPSLVFSVIISKLQLELKGGNFDSCPDCKLIYRPGKYAENPADFMSRHPRPSDPELPNLAEDFVHYVCSNAVPKAITLEEIKQQTKEDAEMRALIKAIETDQWNSPEVQGYETER